MKLKNKIILLLATVLLLYGGLYIFNFNATPKVKLIDAKYLSTETLKDLELESELIVKAVKVDEDNKVIVTTSSSDSSIKYEDPITLSTFKIEEIYYDETNTFQESDKIIVEEFAGYTRNSFTGRSTLIIPKEYTLTKQDNSYVLFVRKSKSSPENYIIFANHFGKFANSLSEKEAITSKLDGEYLTTYQIIEIEVFKKYH